MNKLSKFFAPVTRLASKTGLVMKAKSPEILVVAGVASIVTGTVLMCKSTLKVDEVLTKYEDDKDRIDQCAEDHPEDYPEEAKRHDKFVNARNMVFGMVKIYGPGASLMAVGIACMLGSYGIMRKRNVALMAAYKTMESAFSEYRKRVADRYGDEVEKEILHGFEPRKKNEPVEGPRVMNSGGTISPYARFFDETCRAWCRDAESNLYFLRCIQQQANDMLQAKGHLFLNEVYDLLDIERTTIGQYAGWVLGNGDDYIDFGIYDIDNKKRREFVNGIEKSILLDFNCDGDICGLIEESQRGFRNKRMRE